MEGKLLLKSLEEEREELD